jgi:hypothetical protein
VLAAASLVVAIGTASTVADADPEREATAQALFDEGRTLLGAGRTAEACAKLLESKRLDAGIGVTLQLGDCYQRLGRTATAWAQFRDAEDMARRAGDPRVEVARRRAGALDAGLCRLAIVLSEGANVAGLELSQDGEAVGPTRLGVPVPVDPGRHVIDAKAPGRRPWSLAVELTPAQTRTVTVPVPEPSADAPKAAPTPAPDMNGPSASTPSPTSTQRTLGWVTAGVGAGALALGAYFGLRAIAQNDASNADGHCTSQSCDDVGASARRDALAASTRSDVAFVAGGALLAVGVVLLLTAPTPASTTALRSRPAGTGLGLAW